MRRLSVPLSLLALVLVVAWGALGRGAPTGAQDGTPAATAGHPLVGSWVIDTDIEDTEDAPSVVLFTPDGGYVEVGGEGFASIGAWEATGERTANLMIVSPFTDEEGHALGTFIVRATIEVDASGDTLTGQYTGEVLLVDGTVSGQYGPVSAAGDRIAVEAMGTPVGSFDELDAFFAELFPEGTPVAGTPPA